MRFVDARTQNPFMRTAWLGCWYRSYLPPGSSTYVVILRNGRGIVAVAPMTVRRIGPVRLFRFAGHGVSNYLDIVAPDEELPFALATLLQHIAAMRPSVLEWHDLNSESVSFDLVPGR